MGREIAGLVLVLVAVAAAVALVVGYQPETTPEENIQENIPLDNAAPHYEVIGIVTQVTDGDTIDVWIEDVVADLDPAGEVYANTDETIRFGGGIQAPELAEEGGPESGDFVNGLCPLWTRVYLDLDNLAVGGQTGRPYRGSFERLIAVVYVNLDGQWVNVNAELLRWGMEAYPGYDWDRYTYIESEFDMYEWPPYDNDYPYVRATS